MRRLFLFVLCLLAVGLAKAKLQVSTESDGTVVLTLQSSGDLDREFNGQYGAAVASDFLRNSGALTASKIKIVTTGSTKMSKTDLYRLYGEEWGGYQHFSLVSLNLSDADIENQEDLKGLAWLTSMKKVIYPTTTSAIPGTFSKDSKCKIEEVVIPDNASINLTIANQAFQINSLKKITIGARKDIHVGNLCFQGDANLTTVDFRYGSTNIVIGNQAFDRCMALKNIVLPEGVTEIGNGAFLGAGIEAIRLPNSLKTIKTKAFAQCASLKTITIPEGVEQIETAVFENNYNLSDVYVLGMTTKCAEGAFTDNITYKYTIDSFTDGQKGVTREKYKPEDGNMKVRTVLHFRKEAYANYANEYIKVIGTPEYSTSAYKDHPELNHWVFDDKGNKLPVKHSSYFEGLAGDYAGWKNFMLIDGTLGEQIHIDETRVHDKWYSLCLPFDMTEEQLQSAYGATVEVVEFSSVDVEEIAATRDKYITLNFKQPVTSTKAHHPYMIHPGIHSGTLKGVKVTIVGVEKKPETQTNLDGEKTVITSTDGIQYTFIGNYAKNKGLQQYSYFYYSGDDETQWKNGFYKWTSATGGTWTPYTACILLSRDNGAQAKPKMMFYETPDNTVTSIETLPMTTVPQNCKFTGNVMNLNGQVVRTGSMSLTGLSKGIYIVNGKKIVVR